MSLHFGFSYIGLLFLIMLFVPNFFWTKHKPQNYDTYAANENKALLTLERVGEVLVTCIVLIFSDFNFHIFSLWSIWLGMALLLMMLYEAYWIRYFCSEKTMQNFYNSLIGIPVAGATLPVAAFFLLGIYGKNAFLLLATLILGIGHIGIHLIHWREVTFHPNVRKHKTAVHCMTYMLQIRHMDFVQLLREHVLSKNCLTMEACGFHFLCTWEKQEKETDFENGVLFYCNYPDEEEILSYEEFVFFIKDCCRLYIAAHPESRKKIQDMLHESQMQ